MKKEQLLKNLFGLNNLHTINFKDMKNKNINKKDNEITRKEALKKMSTYAAFTALGTFALLNPKAAAQSSPGDEIGRPMRDRR